jgi:hypothetical protein
MNENIKILLEQILENLENVNNELENNRKPTEDPILKVIEQRLQGVESIGPVVNHNLAKLGSAHLELAKTIQEFEPINQMKVEYNHVFFPGLIAWLNLIKKGSFVWGLGFLLIVSIYFNGNWYQKKEYYKPYYYKYNAALFYNLDLELLDTVYLSYKSRTEYLVDSIVAKRDKIQSMNAELNNLRERKKELQDQLDSTR